MLNISMPVSGSVTHHVLAAYQQYGDIENAEMMLQEELEKSLHADLCQQQIKAVARKIVRAEPRARRAA